MFDNEAVRGDGDGLGWGPITEIRGFLIGTAIETEATLTVVKDDVELFDETLPLSPDTVPDSSCGEVERRLATAEISD